MRDVHPSTKKCRALTSWKDLGVWWIMFCLNEVVQVTTRSLAVSNSVTFFSTDERWLFFIPPQNIPTAVKPFWIFWLMTNHVSFERGHAGCNQVFSCKQFGDTDWLNACQAAKVIHKCYVWMPQCWLCPYRYWSMLGVHANAKAEDWLGVSR